MNNKRSDNQMQSDLETGKIESIALNYTLNFLNEKEKRINPFKYIEHDTNEYILFALNMLDKSLMPKLEELIDSLGDIISPVRNQWYKEVLRIRLEKLLKLKENLQ